LGEEAVEPVRIEKQLELAKVQPKGKARAKSKGAGDSSGGPAGGPALAGSGPPGGDGPPPPAHVSDREKHKEGFDPAVAWVIDYLPEDCMPQSKNHGKKNFTLEMQSSKGKTYKAEIQLQNAVFYVKNVIGVSPTVKFWNKANSIDRQFIKQKWQLVKQMGETF